MTDKDSLLSTLRSRYGMIGDSPEMLDAMQRLIQVAPTDLSVLITGETGTGKEVFSNAIHGLSARRKNAFVSVNCSAIPETLLESELFGHEKGAFTGATEQRKGFFEVAHRGTIFLDEIGEMPLGTQVKLLRVLESGEFNRLGSTTVVKVDVRLVAATNRDLEYEVRHGNFRQDLFFRLNAVQIHLPPLRKHVEDIESLISFFASRICEKNGFDFEGIDDDAIELLQRHSWRGNVRELRNLVETLVTIGRGARLDAAQVRRYLTPERYDEYNSSQVALVHVPRDTYTHSAAPADANTALLYQTLLQLQQETHAIKQAFAALVERLASMPIAPQPIAPSDEEFLRDRQDIRLESMEKLLIQTALKRYHGSRRNAARALGISERTLYRKIQDYGLEEVE